MLTRKIILASGPVIIEDDRVLLNKHGDTTFWKFCGGKVEDDVHNLIEHAQREAMEEMGIEIEILDDKPFLMHTFKEVVPGSKIDVILVHYLARRLTEIAPGEDIREWQWVPIADLGKLEKKGELAPNIMPTLKHFRVV